MPANISNVDGKQVIFGLDWVALSGELKEHKEVKALAQENVALYQVRHKGEDAIVYGFLSQDALSAEIKKANLVSAAVLLATTEQIAANAIFIEVEAQNAKLAILENGVPSPGGDFYGSVQEAEEIIRRIQNDAYEPFTFYGNYFEVYSNTIPLSLVDLLDNGDVAAATLVEIKGNTVKWLGGFALFLLCFCAYFLYSDHQKEQKKIAALKLAQQKNTPVNPTKLYAESLRIAASDAGIPSSKAAGILAESWQKQETVLAGWKLSEIDCLPQACSYFWRIDGGNNKTLYDALPGISLQYSLDGKSLAYTKNINVQYSSLDVNKLPTFNEFQITTGAFIQGLRSIGVQVSIGQLSVFGASPDIKLSEIKSPVRFGTLNVSGDLSFLNEIFSRFPDNLTFRHLNIQIQDGQPTFRLEGNYYVKN